MNKIYKRSTLKTTNRKKDWRTNRERNIILNFRVSEKEKEMIERRIELTGLEKAEFFIESCLYQAVLVRGNIKSFDKIRKRLDDLEQKLFEPKEITELDSADRETVRMILEILDRLYGERRCPYGSNKELRRKNR